MVGIALEQVFLRHAVEGDEDDLRLEGELRQLLLHGGDERVDIDRIVVVGRRDAHARLPAHVHERAEGLIAGGGRGGGRVLRVERHQENAVAALIEQGLDALAHLRLAVAHGPIDSDPVAGDGLQVLGDLLGLVAGDGLERALVTLVVPDRRVIAALGAGALGEDDEVEDRPPDEARGLDDAPVGEELLQVAAHRPVAGALRRSQVHQKHADPPGPRRRVVHRADALAQIGQFHALVHQQPLGRRILGESRSWIGSR